MALTTTNEISIVRLTKNTKVTMADTLICEVPVALIYNGVPHVVLMCTPENLEDLAVGFSLTEGIIHKRADILSIKVHVQKNGIELLMEIPSSLFQRLQGSKRQMVARTGCGVCGAATILNVVRPLKSVIRTGEIVYTAVIQAMKNITGMQTVGNLTGAAHIAALCNQEGEIIIAREDVGRHVALDKLIGAVHIENTADLFCLVSSRASYEMVQKAIVAGYPVLVSVSAPTAMAVELAKTYQLGLAGFVRKDRFNIYNP